MNKPLPTVDDQVVARLNEANRQCGQSAQWFAQKLAGRDQDLRLQAECLAEVQRQFGAGDLNEIRETIRRRRRENLRRVEDFEREVATLKAIQQRVEANLSALNSGR